MTVPIQLIDSTFATPPSACTGALTGPAAAGYNGILGVQQWIQDCGPDCEPPNTSNGWYFGCSGSTCTGVAVAADSQVTNPVAALPTDGNGVVVQLPSVPLAGAPSAAGYLVLGIGTRTNNVPGSSVAAFPLDGKGEFRTTVSGEGTASSFVDTGSNGIFFPTTNAALTTCSPPDDSWFCPATPQTLSATTTGWQGTPSRQVTFQISSISALGNTIGVSGTVGGPAMSSTGVDWGLPFHLGRTVYVGIETRKTPLGLGPVVGY